MKFLVDAQLPLRLARVLQSAGRDTIHTKDLPRRNANPDSEINWLSIQKSRIIITKDRDFLDSYHVRSIDHNIPAGRVFEIVNYWQILLVNPPLPDFG